MSGLDLPAESFVSWRQIARSGLLTPPPGERKTGTTERSNGL